MTERGVTPPTDEARAGEPRTEAGRALLDSARPAPHLDWLRNSILAIEREAAAAPVLDGREFGRMFGEVMRAYPKADAVLVNDILRTVARLSEKAP